MVLMAHATLKTKKSQLITIYFQEAKTATKKTVLHSDFFCSDYQDLVKDMGEFKLIKVQTFFPFNKVEPLYLVPTS